MREVPPHPAYGHNVVYLGQYKASKHRILEVFMAAGKCARPCSSYRRARTGVDTALFLGHAPPVYKQCRVFQYSVYI